MPKTLTDEEYHATLPRKVVGTAVIFRNQQGEILIVEPDYQKKWLLVGGTSEAGESPRQAAIREVKEETGLDITNPPLLGICFTRGAGIKHDHFCFMYDGGILSKAQITSIVLQESELLSYKFLSLEQTLELVSDTTKLALPACLNALNTGEIVYLER